MTVNDNPFNSYRGLAALWNLSMLKLGYTRDGDVFRSASARKPTWPVVACSAALAAATVAFVATNHYSLAGVTAAAYLIFMAPLVREIAAQREAATQRDRKE
jgi:hypothetical protein